ncbi:glycine zipper 2TM domain-containing protein [Qipengyuania marisflavi]|uniref:17 kDa surface antigen n=1 Tax=Qipengyuania marisflavi TaxID=2486356 RepID=A0A5S3P9P5_9SPHN|nr:glycine zipper 2TM domain-containing protein [Qipengyuania marisflavi]TMM50181.1 glycine zipper 2TM domain-containing protein [Qipengyuania marisflavi]
MKKIALSFAAAALALTGLGTAAPALADPPHWAQAHGKHKKHSKRGKRYKHKAKHHRSYYRAPARQVRVVRVYDDRGYYVQPRRVSRSSYVWRGRDNRYYCRRDNGTTGLLIGAGVGALAGHELAGRGDKTLGALLGAAAGGLLGRSIDRGDMQCR